MAIVGQEATMKAEHMRSVALWLGFLPALAWLVVIRLPYHVSKWAWSGGSTSQRSRRVRRREQQAADWAQIEQAIVTELARRRWPDTALYRSILFSGKWGRR